MNSKNETEASELIDVEKIAETCERLGADTSCCYDGADLLSLIENTFSQQKEDTGQRESELIEVISKLMDRVSQYKEYFSAIERGEYNNNRRNSPLRTYEKIMQDVASEALTTAKEKLAALGVKND